MDSQFDLSTVSRITNIHRSKILHWVKEFDEVRRHVVGSGKDIRLAYPALGILLRLDELINRQGRKTSYARRMLEGDIPTDNDTDYRLRLEELNHRLRELRAELTRQR